MNNTPTVIPYNAIYWYDIESLPNFFSCCIYRDVDDAEWIFEISDWVHQGQELFAFIMQVANSGGRLGGYNNVKFDYPVLHMLMEHQGMIDAITLKHKSNYIIECGNRGEGWNNVIWDNKQFVPQLDLMMIHHFDNKAKMTSLKLLEFNMRMNNIVEMDIDWNAPVDYETRCKLLKYNSHDVHATRDFGRLSKPMIEFRDKLTEKYDKNFTNHNDTKIGADFFVMRLADAGIKAHKNIQSPRVNVDVSEIILPYVKFEHPEFQRILEFFRNALVPTMGDGIKKYFSEHEASLTADIDGFHVVFGGGGIHASLKKTICRSSETHQIIDSDVASFYPNLAIKNDLFPEHLTRVFCDVYLGVYEERKTYPKKTAENNMMKLALNGVYGKSNDVHSPFLDPKYTLATTINGQLLLCMLMEQLIKIPGLEMIQMNTDGLTYACPRGYVDHAMRLSEWWEGLTKLELEHAPYEVMPIRDVNSYMAKTDNWKIKDLPDGEGLQWPPDDYSHRLGDKQYATLPSPKNSYVKRIGCYAHVRAAEDSGTRELPWNKDHSAVVIAKAAEHALIHGGDIAEFIHNHDDVFDFFLRTKVPRSSSLICESEDGTRRKEQNVSRYYISTTGESLIKEMPPTEALTLKWNQVPHWKHRDNGKTANSPKPPSGKYDQIPKPSDEPPTRRMAINKGFLVTVCNNLEGHEFNNIDYDFYIAETHKIVDELLS